MNISLQQFRVFIAAFCLLSVVQLQAQTERILNGLVVSAEGKPLRGVSVSIDNSKSVVSNQEGKFSIIMTKAVTEPSSVEAVLKGYFVQDWQFNSSRRAIRIVLSPRPVNLEGKLLDLEGKPIADVEVAIPGVSEEAVVTDKKGSFVLQMPGGMKLTSFSVGDELVDKFKYNSKLNYVEIKISREKVADKVLADGKFLVVEGKESDNSNPVEEIEIAPTFEEIAGLKPTLVVVVYDEDISPAGNKTVMVDGKKYLTDEKGEFKVVTDSVSNSDFAVPEHEIIKKQYDYDDNYMFIHIKDPNSSDEIEVAEVDFEGNFENLFEQLESEKQILQENGQELRKEIQKIAEKLQKGNVLEEQRESLEAYLKRLEAALVENELAFQDAQFKTHTMLEKMKSKIVEKEEKIEEIEEKSKSLELTIELLIGGAIILVVLLVVFYRFYVKIKKQHYELEVTHKELKVAQEEVIKAQDDMLAVSEIGQTFTSTLDFERHMADVKSRVNAIVDATVFGIGIFDELRDKLVFTGTQDGETELPVYEESLDDIRSLAAWCFNHKSQVVINDAQNEITNYIPEGRAKKGAVQVESIIYMPLFIEENPVGVLTLQSYKKGAYSDGNKVSTLKTLASYASIAVANSNAYRVIQMKNDSITDSIRYAKTIQDAILPASDELGSVFKDHFVIYRSKDIVSGDFYWINTFKDTLGIQKTLIGVVDCTGHGVPGAFMSMIGNTLLNEIVSLESIHNTATILEELDKRVKLALKQDEGQNDDGMDVCLCLIEQQSEEKSKVVFTGAKRPLYYLPANSGKINTFSGDLRSIGGFHKTDRRFTTQEIIAHKGDVIYLTSDGFIDQNNPDREKFGTLRLLKLLEENDWQTMDRQREILETALLEHQAGIEQRDDITIIGIKF